MPKNVGEFPERLQCLREKKGLSRIVLSELCGLAPDTVRRYERKESKPTLAAAVALANYFGVSVDYLIGRDSRKIK